MEQRDLKDYKDFLPSRAKLGRLSLWGVTEEERQAASRMLDTMIKAGISDKEPISWEDSSWNPVNIPTLEEMKLSPTGRATLELLRANAPMSAQQPEPAATVAQVEPEPAAGEQPAPPEPEPVNEHLQKISWPPKPTSNPQPPPRPEEPPDWIRHLDRPQVTPWIDDSNNQPIC